MNEIGYSGDLLNEHKFVLVLLLYDRKNRSDISDPMGDKLVGFRSVNR